MKIKSQNWVKKHGSAKSPLQKSIFSISIQNLQKRKYQRFLIDCS